MALCTVLGSVLSSHPHIIFKCLMLVFPKLVLSSERFQPLTITDFLEN